MQLRSDVSGEVAAHRLGMLPNAAAYFDNAALEATLRDAAAIMDVLVGVMLLLAIVMAIALLYNAMSANLAERSVKLGTLHAAGMSRGVPRPARRDREPAAHCDRNPDRPLGRRRARSLVHVELREPRVPLGVARQASTVVLVCIAVFAASVVAQWSTWRGLRRINVASIVRERSL